MHWSFIIEIRMEPTIGSISKESELKQAVQAQFSA
jgi:hypothetical protein